MAEYDWMFSQTVLPCDVAIGSSNHIVNGIVDSFDKICKTSKLLSEDIEKMDSKLLPADDMKFKHKHMLHIIPHMYVDPIIHDAINHEYDELMARYKSDATYNYMIQETIHEYCVKVVEEIIVFEYERDNAMFDSDVILCETHIGFLNDVYQDLIQSFDLFAKKK